MTSIKGHFDGNAVVLDEPATLEVGQAVRVIVKSSADVDRDVSDMTDDELAEWLEVETHKLRGVPYNHHSRDGRQMTSVGLPLRAVCDTNVFLQAMARPAGPAGACIDAVRDGRVTLFISSVQIAELADVASRPSLRAKLRLSDAGTLRFLEELRSHSSLIDPVPVVFEHVADPKDAMIVNLAVAAGAHVITSRDRHLLSLRDPSHPAGREFMTRFGFIDVLTPVELLDRLRTA